MASQLYKPFLLLVASLVLLVGCREPFEPEIAPSNTNLLVVEGFINAGPSAVTTINLSRTFQLTGQVTAVREKEAQVQIESENGTSYPLVEQGEGVYKSGALFLPFEQKYRLRVKTKASEEFVSDYSPVKITPVIDNITYKHQELGLQIYVETHDADNSSQYYKWEYEETWQITPRYSSIFKYQNGEVVPREAQEVFAMRNCWATSTYKDILVGSTVKFTSNEVKFPLLLLSPTTDNFYADKSSEKYSILVKQRALHQAEFEFLELMKKNSSSLGSFFDPQPSEVAGNFKSLSSPGQLVVGYVGAYTEAEKRIFIESKDFPRIKDTQCFVIEADVAPDSLKKYFGDLGYIPTEEILKPEGDMFVISAYLGVLPYCVDCRFKGSSIKPDFWE